MTVADCMHKDVITVSPEANLIKALKLMFAHGVSALPVIHEKDQLIGIISKSDIAVIEKKLWGNCTVNKTMSEEVHHADAGSPIKEALACMVEHNVYRLPVLKKGKLVGIVTRDDVIRHFCSVN